MQGYPVFLKLLPRLPFVCFLFFLLKFLAVKITVSVFCQAGGVRKIPRVQIYHKFVAS